jgi:hypothetical protein
VWTARLGDAYVDPAVLLAASGVPSVHLVPVTRSRPGPGRPRPPVTAAAVRWALEGDTGARMLASRPGDRQVTPHTPDPGHPTVAVHLPVGRAWPGTRNRWERRGRWPPS